jgi:hypothetical protein
MDPNFDPRFDQDVTIKLKRDEAITLLWYLTRELWNGENLRTSFVHAAEEHGLEALVQEIFAQIVDTGSPQAEGIEHAARAHLLNRFR